jgi:6,7-dimethyl-8-ribityllumazine synthase
MRILNVEPIKNQFNIVVIVSRFNENITQKLYEGAMQRLKELNFHEEQITVIWVPGAVEIPLIAQRIAHTESAEAIICLGSVIRGETSHYDYVCQQVSDGCQKVSLENDIPVIFGVLTTEDEAQALERCGGVHGHKGRDAVDAAMHMASLMRQIG